MRLIPRSLHGRMLLVSGVATALALILAGLAMASLLERFVIEGLDRRLDAEVALLASVVDGDGHVDRARLATRVGALESGPGWRWRIDGPDGTIGSRDFPVLAATPAPPLPGPPPAPAIDEAARLRPLDGASEAGVAVHARRLTVETRRGAVTLTAAAPRDVVARPIRGALLPLLAALLGVAALLTTAVLVQLRIGLRPLRRLRDDVARLRVGRLTRVDEDQPSELRPLAVELNALAADNHAALAAARGSAANLAHALKTPVATLAIEVRDQPHHAALVARIDRTIRHHLARARAAIVNRRSATPLRPAVAGVVAVVRRLHDRPLAFAVHVPDEAQVAVDAQDLDELLGNLLDNAARYAATRVDVTAVPMGRAVEIAIADDGPGISTEGRARVVMPGTRLDERSDGHGFGLSIVAELVALYGGAMALDAAEGGGLAVRLTLPTL